MSPEPTKVMKLKGGLVSIVNAMQPFGWTLDTRFAWQLDPSSMTLLAQDDGI